MKEIKFILSDNKYLKLSAFGQDIECLLYSSWVELHWCSGENMHLVGLVCAADLRLDFEKRLAKAIEGALLFDDSLCVSPGVMTNKYFIPEVFRGRLWEMKSNGIKYSIFSAYKDGFKVSSSLYNDKSNNIFFEFGERFCWPDVEAFSERELLTVENKFLKFIDHYQPIVREQIPLNIAKTWLDKVRELKEILFKNENADC